MTRYLWRVGAGVLMLLCAGSASAQYERGTLAVTVNDEAGKPVSGAAVECVEWNGSFPRMEPLTAREQGKTDAAGRATFEDVAVGQVFLHVVAGELGGWFRVQDRKPETTLTIGAGRAMRIMVRDESGKPVQGVRVLAKGTIPLGITDTAGQLEAHNMGVTFTPFLHFWKAGYAWEQVQPAFAPVELRVTLRPGIALECLVTDDGGKPVAGASVEWNNKGSLVTDAQGMVRFPEAPVGLAVTLHADANQADKLVQGEAKVTLSKPPLQKATITMVSPQQFEEQNPGVTLRGKVVDVATGKPVAARIMRGANGLFERPRKAATTDAEGRFAVEHVRDDRLWICAAPDDPKQYAVGGPVEIDVKHAPSEIVFKIDEGCALRGRVLKEDGTPASRTEVMFAPRSPYTHSVRTDDQGQFSITWLDGIGVTYKLSVRDELGNETSVAVAPLAKGEIREGIELRLPKEAKPGALKGTVVDSDGKPVASANLVFAYRERGREPSAFTATSDERGAFSARVPHAGAAKVSAHSVMQVGTSQNATSNYVIVEGGDVEFKDGVDAEIRLVVRPAVAAAGPPPGQSAGTGPTPSRTLEYRIVDEEGKPIPQANPRFLTSKGEESRSQTVREGSYLQRELPTEPYVLLVQARQYQARALFPGTDFQEGDQNLKIVLRKGAFPVGVSVWEAVTGRPATQESVDSTPLGSVLRKRERLFFLEAMPPEPKHEQPMPSAAPRLRVVDSAGQPVTHIVVETPTLPRVGIKMALLPPEAGGQKAFSSEDGTYVDPPTNGFLGPSPPYGAVISAPGLARTFLRSRMSPSDAVRTVVLPRPGTIELRIKPCAGRSASETPVWLPNAAWQTFIDPIYAFVTKADDSGLVRFTDVVPGVHAFAVGTREQDMQVITVTVRPGEVVQVAVALEERSGSTNPLVLMQTWREMLPSWRNSSRDATGALRAQVGALPVSVQRELARTVGRSLAFFGSGEDTMKEYREEFTFLTSLATAVRCRGAAKELTGVLAALPNDVGIGKTVASSAAFPLAYAIADIAGDDSVGTLERVAGDATRSRSTRIAALLALGRIHSKKSAAAFARLRDAAYGKPGAPERRASYTHAERMTEAAIMTFAVIAGPDEPRTTLTAQNVEVDETGTKGKVWMNGMHLELERVGREWMVSSVQIICS